MRLGRDLIWRWIFSVIWSCCLFLELDFDSFGINTKELYSMSWDLSLEKVFGFKSSCVGFHWWLSVLWLSASQQLVALPPAKQTEINIPSTWDKVLSQTTSVSSDLQIKVLHLNWSWWELTSVIYLCNLIWNLCRQHSFDILIYAGCLESDCQLKVSWKSVERQLKVS